MIKSSNHKFINIRKEKSSFLSKFINDYRSLTNYYINLIWDNNISFISKKKNKTFSIKSNQLDLPIYLPIKYLNSLTSDYSNRLMKSASAQALGMIKSAVSKRKSLLFYMSENNKNNLTHLNKNLKKKLHNTKLIKPNANNIFPELNKTTIKIDEICKNLKSFDLAITLNNINKKGPKKDKVFPIDICFLSKKTKHSKTLSNLPNCKRLNSVLLKHDSVQLRWKYEPSKKQVKKVQSNPANQIVGCDTGINNVITLSNRKSTSNKVHNHGHTLNSILKTIKRKKKGSKAFKRALKHRDNFINWSVKNLDMTGIKQINLEKVSNFRYKRNIGKFLNYSGEALIRERLIERSKQLCVEVVLKDSAYISRRCSQCGYVAKSNRKGSTFLCGMCSYKDDADYNASCNHTQSLPSANWMLALKVKPKSFYWKSVGIYSLLGQELTVPVTASYGLIGKHIKL